MTRSIFLLAVLLLTASSAIAQIRPKASPKATVSQAIDSTIITVEYSRPSARGRKLFGGLVKWGKVWTPGANWATTLEATRDIKLAGESVAAGKYSVWALPDESEWRILLHPESERYHIDKPKPSDCRYDIPVVAHAAGEQMEELAFYFSEAGPDRALLNLHWGNTIVPLLIEVEPSFTLLKLSAAEAALYSGRYSFAVTLHGKELMRRDLTIVTVDGQLRGYLGANERFQFVPTGKKHTFYLAAVRDGVIVNMEDDPLIFDTGDGERANSYELRSEASGEVFAGTRLD